MGKRTEKSSTPTGLWRLCRLTARIIPNLAAPLHGRTPTLNPIVVAGPGCALDSCPPGIAASPTTRASILHLTLIPVAPRAHGKMCQQLLRSYPAMSGSCQSRSPERKRPSTIENRWCESVCKSSLFDSRTSLPTGCSRSCLSGSAPGPEAE